MPTPDEIAAAVAAYDRANPSGPLPRNAARLLAAMFPRGDICQRSLDNIAALGFGRQHLPRTLYRLTTAGFVSRQGLDTYRLHLPRRRQP
jgi:hypothetical protein